MSTSTPGPKALKKARIERELTAAALGEIFGVTGDTVRNWEQGRYTPHASYRKQILTWIRDPEAFENQGSKTKVGPNATVSSEGPPDACDGDRCRHTPTYHYDNSENETEGFYCGMCLRNLRPGMTAGRAVELGVAISLRGSREYAPGVSLLKAREKQAEDGPRSE